MAASPPIALVDLSKPHEEVVQAFTNACKTEGFFYLTNHGIDRSLMDDVLHQSQLFFALPEEEKKKVAVNEKSRGYTPFQEEKLDPANQSKGDTKEGYYIGREIAFSDPRAAKPLHGPNQWPPEALLPTWRPIMEQYFASVEALGQRMLVYLALALNLPQYHFRQPGMFDDATVLLRLLHYTAEKSDAKSGVFGAGAHTDFGVFTFLMTDKESGLQIAKEVDGGETVWRDVPPMKGAFIVNLGDVIEMWSNKVVRSTKHRVMIGGGRERYSVPVFFEPNYDCMVETLPSCCSESNPARYPPVQYGKYLEQRYAETSSYDKSGDAS